METPPINSRTNELAFIRELIAPRYINLVIKFPDEKSIENRINKTIETIICINKSENIFLIQALKNHDVFCNNKDKKAKGVSKIKSFTITYLNEYVKTKFNKDIVREVFIKPSNEKISIDDVFIEIKLFIFSISSEKHIFLLNNSSPIPLIDKVILENISNNSEIKK